MSEFGDQMKQRTEALAKRVVKMSMALPNRMPAWVLGKQVLRSGTSVGANYREAFRPRSTAEFLAKIGDCLKEAEETDYWLSLLCESGLITQKRLAALRQETRELTRIFASILKTKKREKNS